MKLTTAVVLAGTAVSAAVSAAAVTRVRQQERHHGQEIEVAAARVQMDWLSQVATNHDLAKLWAPEDMDPEEYMKLMHANRQLCAFSLRDRLGLVTDEQRDLFASVLMQNPAIRAYWERFRSLRIEEAATARDERGLAFTAAFDRVARERQTADA
ncbi:DUF6082 family protein [Streptomyces pseudogriseolus]|uniref:DUF6082 family protein n=1 Tax=Streptomyces pseudogriseolus TaxID=36817 RepID=UPI003FA2A0C1